MTNNQFRRWRERRFPTRSAAAQALGIDRDTVTSLEDGKSRKGNPYPVPAHIALACAAYTLGLRDYDGGAVMLGG